MGSLFHKRPRLPDPVPLPAPAPVVAPPPVEAPPAPPALRLGLNVHRLTDAHRALCRELGVTQLRTTLYPVAHVAAFPFDVVVGLDAAHRDGVDLLLVLNGDPARWADMAVLCAQRWPDAALQLGNECDADTASNAAGRAVAPDEYVAWWRAAAARVPDARLVTAAVGGENPAQYADALLSAGLTPHAVAVHAYGPPPYRALMERAGALVEMFTRQGRHLPLWCTEFGIAPKDIRRAWPTDDAGGDETRIMAEWQEVASTASWVNVERAYGYCLDADDGGGYGIAGTPTADWLAQTQGVAKAA